MDAEALGNSRILNLLFKPAGVLMESNRKWFNDPIKTLRGADIQPGQTVLEVGCGTGFFTIQAAQMIGKEGCLIAIDVLRTYIERVTEKVRDADLTNVRVVKRNALNTGLDAESIDMVLLFGVVPFPAMPLNKLLPEMHRILKPQGTLAVWLFPPVVHFWVPKSILQSELFTFTNKQNGVYNYKRC